MIIGADLGYGFIKDSEYHILESRMMKVNYAIDAKEKFILKYNDTQYVIEEGQYTVDVNKIKCESNKIFLYAILSKNASQDFKIVTGLPIAQYHKYKDDFKDDLLKDRIVKIELNGVRRTFIIDDVFIYPQCLGAYYTLNNTDRTRSYDIIDIGTGTIDIAMIREGKIIRYSTLFEGTLTLYDDFIKAVNDKYDLTFKLEDACYILENGLYIYGQRQDLSFTRDIIIKHTDQLFKELEINYSPKASVLMITGGGAYLYNGIFKARYPHTEIIKDSQFANAVGFKKVGESIWQK